MGLNGSYPLVTHDYGKIHNSMNRKLIMIFLWPGFNNSYVKLAEGKYVTHYLYPLSICLVLSKPLQCSANRHSCELL